MEDQLYFTGPENGCHPQRLDQLAMCFGNALHLVAWQTALSRKSRHKGMPCMRLLG